MVTQSFGRINHNFIPPFLPSYYERTNERMEFYGILIQSDAYVEDHLFMKVPIYKPAVHRQE